MCFSDEEEEVKRLLKKQPFYNVLIEKSKSNTLIMQIGFINFHSMMN